MIDDQRKCGKRVKVKDLEVGDTFWVTDEGGRELILTQIFDNGQRKYYDNRCYRVLMRIGGRLIANTGMVCKFHKELMVTLLNAALVIRPWSEVTDPSRGSKPGGEPWTHKGRPARLTAPKRPGTSAKPSPGRFY